jgi:hypothetical protein
MKIVLNYKLVVKKYLLFILQIIKYKIQNTLKLPNILKHT